MARNQRRYTDEDRALVLATLTSNNGNIARTARDTNVPENTVRGWKREWEENGPPDGVLALAVDQAGDFVAQAEVVRDEALAIMRSKLPDARVSELNSVVGTLDDKITRMRGLAMGRVEHVHTQAVAPEELGAQIGEYLVNAVTAARQRQAEVFEVVEEPGELIALPAPRKE